MDLWEAVVLGVIQGATEFLPVSSSGHLVVGQTLLEVRAPGVFLEVLLHLATLLSVMVVYRKKLGRLIRGCLQRDPEASRYVGFLIVATIPAGLMGVFAGDLLRPLFELPVVTGVALLVTGVVLWSSRGPLRLARSGTLTLRIAVLLGIAQALAIVPGISRSGATVVAALWLGLSAEEAAEFSFLMAIPAIVGAGVLLLPEITSGAGGLAPMSLAVSSLAAALTGIGAIVLFLHLLRKRGFHHFAWYCGGVGALFLLYLSTP